MTSKENLRDRARRLRKDMTDAERRLWSKIRRRQVHSCQFRRQFPLGKFIVDFVCLEHRLIVEVDGGQHTEQAGYDEKRSAWLQQQGFRVIRFWNNEVMNNLDTVVEAIADELKPAL